MYILEFTPEGVEMAYRNAIFPMWDDETDQIYWFQPDPRAIIPLDEFHLSRSLAKTIRQEKFTVTFDQNFEGVMRGCADREEGTWINEDFIALYGELHRQGKAHSVECWRNGRLVGGTYGVSLGGAFMAESMFHTETNASKVALAALVQRLNERDFSLLDVQYLTPHLASLGAIEIPHLVYSALLHFALLRECAFL